MKEYRMEDLWKMPLDELIKLYISHFDHHEDMIVAPIMATIHMKGVKMLHEIWKRTKTERANEARRGSGKSVAEGVREATKSGAEGHIVENPDAHENITVKPKVKNDAD